MIANKADLQPLLIVSGNEGAGLTLSTEVRSTNSLVKVKWVLTQSQEPYLMVQGKAYWFAYFPNHCQIMIDN